MSNHAWCTLCVYATSHKCGKRSPSITANGKCKPKQVFSSLVAFSEQPPVATTQKHISSGQALDLNKEGRKGQNGGRTFSYIYIWPRFYGPMSSELRFGTSILHTSIRTCNNERGDFRVSLHIGISAHKGPIPNRSIYRRNKTLARAAAAAVDHKRDWSINATESPYCVQCSDSHKKTYRRLRER